MVACNCGLIIEHDSMLGEPTNHHQLIVKFVIEPERLK